MTHSDARGVASRRNVAASLAECGVGTLASLTLLGAAVGAVRPGSAVHPHWMGSTGGEGLDAALAVSFAALVLARGRIDRLAPRTVRTACLLVGSLVVASTTLALLRHAGALAEGSLRAASIWPPATLLVLPIVSLWTIHQKRRTFAAPRRRTFAVRAAGFAAAGLLFLSAWVAAVGATDYRAPTDAVLVLGARVHPDGRPSGALVDRTRTACSLWRAGLAPVLVLSGGRDPGAPVSEPQAMRRIALAEGVPETALLLDEAGADTASSIRVAAATARARGWRSVGVVSHDYHLARVRLLAAREGLPVRTVPAEETHARGWKLLAFARELAAFGSAWLGLGSGKAPP